jgi:hypothetical protein
MSKLRDIRASGVPVIFKRGIVGQPLRSNRRHERVSFAVGFALVAGAALATSWSMLWTKPEAPEAATKLVGPTHVEAVEARAGSVPELDESVAVYLPREGAVLGLPLEPADAEPSAEGGEIVGEGQQTSQIWVGLPAFAEAAGTALQVEMAAEQIWASVAGAPSASPTGRRDIWPYVWVPTLAAMPFLLAHKSDGGSSGGGSGTAPPNPPVDPPDTAPAPDLVGDGDNVPPADPNTPGSIPTPPSGGGGSGGGSSGGAGGGSAGGSRDDLPGTQLDLVADGSFAGSDDFGQPGDDFTGGAVGVPSAEPGAATPVPEPSSMLLLGAGLVLVAAFARRRAR